MFIREKMFIRQSSNSTLNFVITMDGADKEQVVPSYDSVASYPVESLCGTASEGMMSYPRTEADISVSNPTEPTGGFSTYTAASLVGAAPYTCLTTLCGAASMSNTNSVFTSYNKLDNTNAMDIQCNQDCSVANEGVVSPYPKFTYILNANHSEKTQTERSVIGFTATAIENRDSRHRSVSFQGIDDEKVGQSDLYSATAKSLMDSANLATKCNQNLMDATEEALVSGKLMPLIKEELKYSIQSRRVMEGKDEMKVEFQNPQQYQLRPDEQQRVETRRVQNRMAARRFRDRQKDRGESLQKRCQEIESMNTQLRFELKQLKKERDELKKHIEEHMSTCPTRQPQFYR